MPSHKKSHEHSARLHDPAGYVSFATGEDKGGRGINFVYGIRKNEGPHGGHSEIQAIRFDSNIWSVEEAKAWIKDHNYSPIKFTAATVDEEGEAAAGPAITTTSIGPGAMYAPKVMDTVARFRTFGKDQYDQSFMSKMRRKLNEGTEIQEGDSVVDGDGKRFRVYNKGVSWVALIPDDGEVSDKIKIPVGDFNELYRRAPSPHDDKAYNAGYYAFNDDGSEPRNPYKKGTDEYKKWAKGLKDREADRENFEGSYIADE